MATLIGLLTMVAMTAKGQERIEIINANELAGNSFLANGAKRLIGNVVMRQKDVVLQCDSAYFYTEKNSVDAFGHVVITQGDSIRATCTLATYDGNTKTGKLTGNVEMVNGENTLRSETVFFNSETKLGYYLTNGTITAKGLRVNSKRGYFYTATKVMRFFGNVDVVGSEFKLKTDSLDYLIETDDARFFGNSTIKTKDYTVSTQLGSYNAHSGKANFDLKNRLVNADGQTVVADKLNVDRQSGYGLAMGHAIILDTTNHVLLMAKQAELFHNGNQMKASGNPILKSYQNGDTTFLYADTLFSSLSADSARLFQAILHVSVLDSQASLSCDSLSYSSIDSTFRCYKHPIAWFDAYQAYGDTLYLKRAGAKPERMTFLANAMVVNRSDSDRFNQLRGRKIDALFNKGQLTGVLFKGNAESIYYVQEDSAHDVGMNHIESTSMAIDVKANRPQQLRTYGKPTGKLTPLHEVKKEDAILRGFQWTPDQKPTFVNPRPAMKYDIVPIQRPSEKPKKPKNTKKATKQKKA